MNAILAIVGGGLGGAMLVWLLRGWITERLKQSIQYEYSQKLENHKGELNARLNEIEHANQLHQLRTSLFFDHQRSAFAALTTKIAAVNKAWIDKHYDFEEGFSGGVPYESYQELRNLYHEHQLFLDPNCITAMEMIFECYTDSFPVHNGSGGPPIYRDAGPPYDRVTFLQPRIAEVFRTKIGISSGSRALHEIALLGAIRILNKYHFEGAGLPVKGALKIEDWDGPGEIVNKADKALPELLAGLRKLLDYLRGEAGSYPELAGKVESYLAILESP